jgi:hypothetical protein
MGKNVAIHEEGECSRLVVDLACVRSSENFFFGMHAIICCRPKKIYSKRR